MAANHAIEVSTLSKSYRLWGDPADRLWSQIFETAANFVPGEGRLRSWLRAKASTYYREFQALAPLSFTLAKGESVGIIGVNGSGKSTLLQLIAGTLAPSTGQVRLNGRVAALLELGSGFSPEFSGRDNVFLNAAILGLTREETEARLPSILEFADIGDFVEQPVKTYSSGMQVRLAFAVAVSVDPDVLIVDEALSVGDIFFQQKCFARIREMLDRGTTLLLVSHDLAAVQNLCSRALLLDRGHLVYAGEPEECATRFYARMVRSAGGATMASGTPPPSVFTDELIHRCRARHGDRDVELLAARVTTTNGTTTLQVDCGDTLRVAASIRANRDITLPSCGFHLYDRMNNLVFATGTLQRGKPLGPMKAGEHRIVTFDVRFSIQPGHYTFNLATGEPASTHSNTGAFHDVCEGLGPIEVLAPRVEPWSFYGIAELPTEVEVLNA